MEFEAFNKKSVVDNKVVMTEATMVFKPGVDVIGVHIVTEEEAGRPDIMSWTFYKTPHKVDLILKWNGISNPFSIEAGTEIEMINDEVKTIENIEVDDVVLTFNEETKQQEYNKVTNVYSPNHDDLVKYIFSNGTELTSTFDHPFYVFL